MTKLYLTFDSAIDPVTLTKASDLKLNCGGMKAAISAKAKDGTDKVFSLTVKDAYKYQLMQCNLTLPSGLKDISGNPLINVPSYTFSNACAISDTFNVDSSMCWDVSQGIQGASKTYQTWDEIYDNYILLFNPNNHTLDYESNTSGDGVKITKKVDVSGYGFSITVHFKNVFTDFFSVKLQAVHNNPVRYKSLSIQTGDTLTGSSRRVAIESVDITSGTTKIDRLNKEMKEQEFYIKIQVAPADSAYSYSTDGVTFVPFKTSDEELSGSFNALRSIQSSDFSGGKNTLSMQGSQMSNVLSYLSVDSLVTTGMTSAEQY